MDFFLGHARASMATPKHKAREKKRKTVFDHLKESALFVLFVILLVIVDIVAFIFWLSGLLSGQLAGIELVTDMSFYLFAGLGVILGVFFLVAWSVQRSVHGSGPSKA